MKNSFHTINRWEDIILYRDHVWSQIPKLYFQLKLLEFNGYSAHFQVKT